VKEAKTRTVLWHVSFDTSETTFALEVLPDGARELVRSAITSQRHLLIEEQRTRTSRGIEVDTAKVRDGEIWDGRNYRSATAFRDKYLHCPSAG
jgi:predicted RNA-binding protein with PUA domain